MTIRVGVTEAKARFSELVNRVAYGGERVIITRHGKPVAELASAGTAPAGDERDPGDWVWKLAGACADDPEFCDLLDEIVADRRNQAPRPLPPLFEDDEHDPA